MTSESLDKKLANKFGKLSGSLISGAKKLPKKTAETGSSIKNEFISGYKSTTSKQQFKQKEWQKCRFTQVSTTTRKTGALKC